MKGHILLILNLIISCVDGQNLNAYALFNSSYADKHYTLTENADSYLIDTTADKVFIAACKRLVPSGQIKIMLTRKSDPFKWDKSKLQNTIVLPESIASEGGKEYLMLSSPIFDSTETFALLYETFDAISCIQSGPVLFQYRNNKWTRIASQISYYELRRGKIKTNK